MLFNNDLASIHGYLCADGYVIKNPPQQKHKYYHIGFRNTNDILLKDFQERFTRVFGICPIITKDGRCKIQSKKIFLLLTKRDTYYSDRWKLPKLTKEQLSMWLRAYFDCDGWVSVVKAKDRKIGLDSINSYGILKIKNVLKKEFGIDSTVKKRKTRNIWSLAICGKDDLEKFQSQICFLHPKKKAKLREGIGSYVSYEWDIPQNEIELAQFISKKARVNEKRREMRIFSICKSNLIKIAYNLKQVKIHAKVLGPWKNKYSTYYCLVIKFTELNNTEVEQWKSLSLSRKKAIQNG